MVNLSFVLAIVPLLAFFFPMLRKPKKDSELNHIFATLFVFAVPAHFWFTSFAVRPYWLLEFLLVYFVLFIFSTWFFSSLKSVQRPLGRYELDALGFFSRLLNQTARILNEEAFFRGLGFLCLLGLTNLPWYVVAIPQALLFAVLHHVPVHMCVKKEAHWFSVFVGAFAFPFLASIGFALLAWQTGQLWLPVVIHLVSNVLVEILHQIRKQGVAFDLAIGAAES